MLTYSNLLDDLTLAPGVSGLEQWCSFLNKNVLSGPWEAAVHGGAQADRVGFAFAAGYQAALRSLFPLESGQLGSLCATEAQGAHPRAIQTALSPTDAGLRLEGEKVFATMAQVADVLFVVAKEGEREGRPALRIAKVPRRDAELLPGPQTPFTPEISHAVLKLAIDGVEVLAGDGYQAYLKPFRTVEDIHVHAALLAFFVRLCGAMKWPASLMQTMLAQLAALRSLSEAPPLEAATHLALAGVLTASEQAVLELGALAAKEEGDFAQRVVRDLPLMKVASKAREMRVKRAWEIIAGG